ncbi:MAG: hypothetical protein AAGG08_14870, partial [Actinomycetota bacterium]
MTRRLRDRDSGNILPMTLILLTFGGLVVTALLTFASTLFLNRPPLEDRSDSLEAVRSATRIAITMQRDFGPSACYPSSAGSFFVNGRNVNVSCTVLETENQSGGRYGLIATSASGGFGEPSIGASGTNKQIRGDVYVSGGDLAERTAGLDLVDGDLVAGAQATAGTRLHRYATVDPTVLIDVTGVDDCTTLFGPSIAQTDVDTSLFDSAVAPYTVERMLPLLTLRVTPDAGTRTVGVIVRDALGNVELDLNDNDADPMVVGSAVTGVLVNDVSICHQPDLDPADLDYIPVDQTFCDSPLMATEQFSHVGTPDGITCGAENWWDYAGWKPNILTTHQYPLLPAVPTYPRSATPTQVGSTNCYVFYPGRYADPVTLDGGHDYYFASGVYLFEDTVSVSDGARVVGGEGSWTGCSFDADAAFLPDSPRFHDITGKGVTWLLSDDGAIDLDDASLRLND